MHASLQIVYEGDLNYPLTAATVEDRRLLVAVARAAIAEAYERAEAIAPLDAFVGEVHRDQAQRLEKVLGLLIPKLRPLSGLQLVPTGAQEPAHDL